MVRTDGTFLLIDNDVEAQIGHTAFPRSGNEEQNDKAGTRAGFQLFLPFLLI